MDQFADYVNFCKECIGAREGFSDEKIEMLLKPTLKDRGLTPWASWEAESTSFGVAFRFWARYPKFLPLFICSDHGVGAGALCVDNEINSKFKTYFTWNLKKSKVMSDIHGKKGFHVPHPWPRYRKAKWGDPPKVRKGTLIFFPHSNSQSEPNMDGFDEYIRQLKNLPEKYHPLTICISFHDVEAGKHKFLRKYGLPIVSAGSGASRKFIDRFYSLIYQFKYTTSPNIGSHCYYILEAGIPFFLFGEEPKYVFKGSKVIPDGVMNLDNFFTDAEDKEQFYKFKKTLEVQLDEVSDEQKKHIQFRMGLNSKITPQKASFILYAALIMNLHRLVPLYIKTILRLLSKKAVSIKTTEALDQRTVFKKDP